MPGFLLFKIPAGATAFRKQISIGKGLGLVYDRKTIVQFVTRALFVVTHNLVAGKSCKVVLL